MMEHYYQSVPGWFWFEEAYKRLLYVLPQDRPSVFVEIGSLQGQSTCWLGVEVVNSGKPVTIHVVDSWVYPDSLQGAQFRLAFDRHTAPIRKALNGRFHVHQQPSIEAAQEFADASVDVVWIDGDHAYEGIRGDILAWWPKLKSGGWMGGDDWLMKPVQQAVGEQFAPNYILVHGWSESPEHTGNYPSWLVRKEE